MLSQITIKKFLYLTDIKLDLVDGVNVFTGETGVGKSLIVDAIAFVLGERGNYPEDSYVELVFENIQNDYSEEGLLIVSRQIKNGKSIYYLNGKRATLSTIKEATEDLVEIYSQHQYQKLFSKDNQRKIFDSFCQIEDLLEEYQKLYKEFKEKEKEYNQLIQAQSERLRELDFLKYQLNELNNANIKSGEKEALEERYSYLSNIQTIKEIVSITEYSLSEEIFEKLSVIIKNLSKIAGYDKNIQKALNQIEEAYNILKDAGYQLSKIELDIDEKEINLIEERLNLINHLERKYNTDEKGLIELKNKIEEKIQELENSQIQIPNLQKDINILKEKINQLAEIISQKRKEKAKIFDEIVKKHLSELALESATFITDIQEKQPDRYGKDEVRFLFSANKGLKPSFLEDTASGGELSRLSLVLRLLTQKSAKTLILDEIDTGIGGKTALNLSKKLKDLSKNFQLIIITHLPQIASISDKHFYIEKYNLPDTTKAVIKEIEDIEKEKEIARMLSGIIDEKSIQLAKNLINSFAKNG
ncbi:DNA repair protein RecN [Venenivibrio stagnispumantis]|uniref:DNA repair protein RecN n=1 Tax=Venenivibrio stagnispumantis TaxID=407998 RepID=A0AA45WMC5_9AQUI|nr:AAA family ATPase [Venenivibrio stagnispumantis]MCW4573604.1 DNA repair protein RecN [Venenivibrio stagnispumantis]SMP14051.1 DNA replication and repair protein RecN [Venenivibrio stagnispumantis]